MVCCEGHWVFWHWIVESFLQEQEVQTSGYHTSPGRWPFGKIYFRFISTSLKGRRKFFSVYLIIACPTFSFSQAFSIVQNGSVRTETAFLQRCATNRSKLGDICRILELSWRFYQLFFVLDSFAGFRTAARLVDEWCGAVGEIFVIRKWIQRDFKRFKEVYREIIEGVSNGLITYVWKWERF